MVDTTLQAMAAGGIFDQIGGGFSRYSTDDRWLIPHFEKMLYDNALLLLTYTEMYQLNQNPFYADIAKRTADYLLAELSSPEGGFYCGQDADSDGAEGKYYTLTPAEITGVLGKSDAARFCRDYAITEKGNFEGQSIPNQIHRPGTPWDFHDPCLQRLRLYRKERVSLHLDRKILLSWNAWTIMALAKAGLIFSENRYTAAAVKAQRFICLQMTDEGGRLFHRYCDKEAAYSGQLDDYAVYALALIELYRSTFQIEYLTEAVLRTQQMLDWFEDTENGGYYQTAHDAE